MAGLAGVVLIIAALVIGAPRTVGWAAAMLLVQYGISLVSRDGVDPGAPVYAAVLLLTVEMAYASLERRRRIPGPSGMRLRGLGRLPVLAVVGWAMAALVVVLASLPVEYGLLVQVAGIGAAAAVVTTLIMLIRARA